MFNPDYPSTSYGWNAFTYQPYDQQQVGSVYYNGQGAPNPFANPVAPSDSRRQIGQQFAQAWGQQPSAQSTPAPAYGYNTQPTTASAQVAQAPAYSGPSMLSPNAFANPGIFGGSPDPSFDCVYNNSNGAAWDKSNSTPAWNNSYTATRPVMPPSIDWTASQKPAAPANPGYGYSAMNPCTATFAQPNDDWMATAKNNFANL